MDIEQLNRTQIVLLTLLVSFVTSIATGIVTVSLMGQAPQGVTQTVNRIVERTVERVVPAPVRQTAAAVTGISTPATQTTVETTVVVKEDDLAADSISKVQTSLVRFVEKGAPETSAFARGVIVDSAGVVAVDRGTTDPNLGVEIILASGLRFSAKPRPALAGESVRLYDLNLTGTTTPHLQAIPLADRSTLRLGQSVIRIGGRVRDTVAQGVISAVSEDRDTNIESTAESVTTGSLLVTIFGELAGIATTDSLSSGAGSYTAAGKIAESLVAERPR